MSRSFRRLVPRLPLPHLVLPSHTSFRALRPQPRQAPRPWPRQAPPSAGPGELPIQHPVELAVKALLQHPRGVPPPQYLGEPPPRTAALPSVLGQCTHCRYTARRNAAQGDSFLSIVLHVLTDSYNKHSTFYPHSRKEVAVC
jgi:hypothetical protein